LALGFNIDEMHSDYHRLRNFFIQFYRQHLSVNTRLFPGMENVLQQLENQDIQWGVVTNKPSHLAKQLLSDLDLADRCACIVGGDCSSKTKPHPDSLLLACEIIHSLPKECVYIGDAERDIKAAKNAGMRSIAALYGYLHNDSAPECWQADYYIDHPKDILFWVEKNVFL
jgi:N-acetyl-D-muramate 6-phosphate phosphatase